MKLTSQPSLGGLYVRALLARKPKYVPEGHSVPRLEGSLAPVRIDPGHLAQYRAVTGWRRDEVPLTYPHVLASGLHLSMLTSPDFPVKLLGLVHLSNRIEQRASLPTSLEGSFVATLEGHRETERGQEFELHTELRVGADVPWREVSTFLARKQRQGPKTAVVREPRPAPERTFEFDAPAGLGRRYGRLAGDLNPIHVSDLTAKLFGFPRAIAHGMWSLARCVAELELSGACTLDAQFKLPVLLPAHLVLERTGSSLTLLDAQREKPHLAATFHRA